MEEKKIELASSGAEEIMDDFMDRLINIKTSSSLKKELNTMEEK